MLYHVLNCPDCKLQGIDCTAVDNSTVCCSCCRLWFPSDFLLIPKADFLAYVILWFVACCFPPVSACVCVCLRRTCACVLCTPLITCELRRASFSPLFLCSAPPTPPSCRRGLHRADSALQSVSASVWVSSCCSSPVLGSRERGVICSRSPEFNCLFLSYFLVLRLLSSSLLREHSLHSIGLLLRSCISGSISNPFATSLSHALATFIVNSFSLSQSWRRRQRQASCSLFPSVGNSRRRRGQPNVLLSVSVSVAVPMLFMCLCVHSQACG